MQLAQPFRDRSPWLTVPPGLLANVLRGTAPLSIHPPPPLFLPVGGDDGRLLPPIQELTRATPAPPPTYARRLIDHLEQIQQTDHQVLTASAIRNVDPNRGGGGVLFIGHPVWGRSRATRRWRPPARGYSSWSATGDHGCGCSFHTRHRPCRPSSMRTSGYWRGDWSETTPTTTCPATSVRHSSSWTPRWSGCARSPVCSRSTSTRSGSWWTPTPSSTTSTSPRTPPALDPRYLVPELREAARAAERRLKARCHNGDVLTGVRVANQVSAMFRTPSPAASTYRSGSTSSSRATASPPPLYSCSPSTPAPRSTLG